MQKRAQQYIIGIDFGTTNCTMAYTRIQEENPDIEQFPIAQISSAKGEEELLMLPSCVYFPLPEEIKAKTTTLSWGEARDYCVGQFARDRGGELPSRLISSPKSWLCHAGVDRRAKLLPLNAEDAELKISPKEACARILLHLKEAWDQKMDAPFASQEILVTVPASFDPGARQLMLEAAEEAGYPEIILLEEPQAAFYAWIDRFKESWRQTLAVGDQVLVIDIGGGTSDFSLITVAQAEGLLQLNRTAVGTHLLLGGDNIDLAVAHIAKAKLEAAGHHLDDWQMQAMVAAARRAKEKLLGGKTVKHADISIAGRGSKLIGGALKTTIEQEEMMSLIMGGFLPLVAAHELSKVERRLGIQQLGLPFAEDPRLTCQLAKFLSQTGDSDSTEIGEFIVPTAVLFNGGTMKAAAFQKRIIEQIDQWAEALCCTPARQLAEGDLDFAVSRGAVYYGLARRGQGIRIKSGTSRSYYIGVEESAPAIPGVARPLNAVCIVPFGMEEGSEALLADKSFALLLGETATFRFFSHATKTLQNGLEPTMGTAVKTWKQELTELHPIETLLDKGEEDGKTIKVHLKSKVTELGMLELWCEADDGRAWKLEFDIRK